MTTPTDDTVTHVVMDASDNPECIDDCPGCEPAARMTLPEIADALESEAETACHGPYEQLMTLADAVRRVAREMDGSR
jgi:hypothetical protein